MMASAAHGAAYRCRAEVPRARSSRGNEAVTTDGPRAVFADEELRDEFPPRFEQMRARSVAAAPRQPGPALKRLDSLDTVRAPRGKGCGAVRSATHCASSVTCVEPRDLVGSRTAPRRGGSVGRPPEPPEVRE